MAAKSSASRFFVIFATLWILAWTWKLYPQFRDQLRTEGRVVSLGEYVEEACGERVGPLATSCRATTLEQGRRLVVSEQAKSLLLLQAPLLLYALVYLPLRLFRRRRAI
ncbi:MAG TPA: hypothetical protein VMC10_03715 [Stellaceae bacterium]|nr:hypothetical protein [Stellaceae bacterium]